MTIEEADRHLNEYRATLKAWTMAISGVSDVDPNRLYRKLVDGQSTLAQIAMDFPDRSRTAETLIHSRTRMVYELTVRQPVVE